MVANHADTTLRGCAYERSYRLFNLSFASMYSDNKKIVTYRPNR